MFALMLFMFFYFLGSIAMFIYLIKKIDSNARQLSEEHAQLRVLLRAMESRMEKPDTPENAQSTGDDKNASSETREDLASGHDPLLHLSFERPPTPEQDFSTGLNINFDPQSPGRS